MVVLPCCFPHSSELPVISYLFVSVSGWSASVVMYGRYNKHRQISVNITVVVYLCRLLHYRYSSISCSISLYKAWIINNVLTKQSASDATIDENAFSLIFHRVTSLNDFLGLTLVKNNLLWQLKRKKFGPACVCFQARSISKYKSIELSINKV